MERVFQKLSLAFGNQMFAKWEGLNMQDVYADWAESLGDVSIGAIDYAISASKSAPHPPNQGEFKAHCKQYRPNNENVHLLERKRDYDPEKAQENLRRMKQMLGGFGK